MFSNDLFSASSWPPVSNKYEKKKYYYSRIQYGKVILWASPSPSIIGCPIMSWASNGPIPELQKYRSKIVATAKSDPSITPTPSCIYFGVEYQM